MIRSFNYVTSSFVTGDAQSTLTNSRERAGGRFAAEDELYMGQGPGEEAKNRLGLGGGGFGVVCSQGAGQAR
jgi:hypothetical protein